MRFPLLTVALLGAFASSPALALDWASVSGKEVTLLYPGQSSFEWVLTQSDHSGGPKFKGGKNCFECHTGEEKTMGANLVNGKKNEPAPIAGKPAFLAATVKVAHDADKLYVHLDFAPGAQPDAKMDLKYDTKVTMMLSDGKVALSDRAGCWAACHDDLTDMASAGGATRTKYLMASRNKITRQGGGDDLKPAADLDKARADGVYLEYWQALLNPGAPAVSNAFTVLEKREDIKANAVTAEASFANGAWSVTLSRKLKAGAPYKDVEAGKTYTIGFAIHGGHTAKRFHYVSFEQSLVLDQGTADFVAAAK